MNELQELAALYIRLEEWCGNDDPYAIDQICDDVMPTIEKVLIANGVDIHKLSLSAPPAAHPETPK